MIASLSFFTYRPHNNCNWLQIWPSNSNPDDALRETERSPHQIKSQRLTNYHNAAKKASTAVILHELEAQQRELPMAIRLTQFPSTQSKANTVNSSEAFDDDCTSTKMAWFQCCMFARRAFSVVIITNCNPVNFFTLVETGCIGNRAIFVGYLIPDLKTNKTWEKTQFSTAHYDWHEEKPLKSSNEIKRKEILNSKKTNTSKPGCSFTNLNITLSKLYSNKPCSHQREEKNRYSVLTLFISPLSAFTAVRKRLLEMLSKCPRYFNHLPAALMWSVVHLPLTCKSKSFISRHLVYIQTTEHAPGVPLPTRKTKRPESSNFRKQA